jgi:hypothetical protein
MHSLTSAVDGGEWSPSCPGRFTPRERAAGIHWIGGWVGPTAILDTVVYLMKNNQNNAFHYPYLPFSQICMLLYIENFCNMSSAQD